MSYGMGATSRYGTGGCPPWSQPYDNSGSLECNAAGDCLPGGGPGCISIFELYPVYVLIGGGVLSVLLLLGMSGRR